MSHQISIRTGRVADSWALYDNAGDEPQLIDWGAKVPGAVDLETTEVYLQSKINSIRRFFALPVSVLLDATGFAEPYPFIEMRLRSILNL
jgi:hypothetical protein